MLMSEAFNKGDRIIRITEGFIAVQRKKGVLDIIPLIKGDTEQKMDIDNIITVCYGDKIVRALPYSFEVTRRE